MQNADTKDRDTENVLNDKMFDLNTTLKQGEERIKNTVCDMEKKIAEGKAQIKTVIADVDKKFQENPWPIVAGVAAGCILLGFIIGSNKR